MIYLDYNSPIAYLVPLTSVGRNKSRISGAQIRLQAVPFWSVERVCSQRSETGARRNKREETGEKFYPFSRLSPSPPPLVCSSFYALGYFARPLDYPGRDCLQSRPKSEPVTNTFLISSILRLQSVVKHRLYLSRKRDKKGTFC